jgi:glucosamine-phosphate N-acetyltransferase
MENEEFTIRKVESKDLDELLILLYQLSPLSIEDTVSKENIQAILEKIINDSNYSICVFEKDGKLLGTGTLLIQMNLSHGGKPYAHIENVVTDMNARGQGIGGKTIDHLVEIAKQNNCYKVLLNCNKDNTSFYAKHNFRESGEIEMRFKP